MHRSYHQPFDPVGDAGRALGAVGLVAGHAVEGWRTALSRLPLVGDVIAHATGVVGIKKCRACEKRRQAMNAWQTRALAAPVQTGQIGGSASLNAQQMQQAMTKYGLSQTAQAGQYVLNEADSISGLPPGTAEQLAQLNFGGDPTEVGIQAANIIAMSVATAALPGTGAILGGVVAAVEAIWAFGACSGVGCCDPSTVINCGNGQGTCGQISYDDPFPGEIESWGSLLDNCSSCSFEYFMRGALMGVWSSWMAQAPAGSAPPDQNGPPDVCWVISKGYDPIAYANAMMGVHFPLLLAEWNAVQVPYSVLLAQCGVTNDALAEVDGGAYANTMYFECSETGSWTASVPPQGTDAISIALGTIGTALGMPAGATITFQANSSISWAQWDQWYNDAGLTPPTNATPPGPSGPGLPPLPPPPPNYAPPAYAPPPYVAPVAMTPTMAGITLAPAVVGIAAAALLASPLLAVAGLVGTAVFTSAATPAPSS